MKLTFIRHGMTQSNTRKCYIGTTDEPLCDAGIREASAIAQNTALEAVFVSPLLRCKMTASILFPKAKQIIISEFRERDFGDFEGKNAEDLKDYETYSDWVLAGCLPACPNGESMEEFVLRVKKGLLELLHSPLLKNQKEATFVIHGGTIMALLSAFVTPKHDFFDFYIGNCKQVICEFDTASNTMKLLDGNGLHQTKTNYKCFTHTSCEYFPCHQSADVSTFNCLYCYCPLYTLGPDCGGSFTYLKDGTKSCMDCARPHLPGFDQVIKEKYPLLKALATRTSL